MCSDFSFMNWRKNIFSSLEVKKLQVGESPQVELNFGSDVHFLSLAQWHKMLPQLLSDLSHEAPKDSTAIFSTFTTPSDSLFSSQLIFQNLLCLTTTSHRIYNLERSVLGERLLQDPSPRSEMAQYATLLNTKYLLDIQVICSLVIFFHYQDIIFVQTTWTYQLLIYLFEFWRIILLKEIMKSHDL